LQRVPRSHQRSWASGLVLSLLLALGCGSSEPTGPSAAQEASEWPSYGGDPGGQRYAVLDQLTPENVGRLEPAWTFHSGDVSDGKGEVRSASAFEATPILVDGLLFFCTPFDRVIALDPATGEQVWSFDPQIDLQARYANQLVCRGVAHWRDPSAAPGARCARRIFLGTLDSRLIALDAATGGRCSDFGSAGEVELASAAGETLWQGEYSLTSPPVVLGDRVVVGAAISDNARSDAPSGLIRAFDARGGRELWAWDLAPPGYAGPRSAAGHALAPRTPGRRCR